MTDRLKGCVVTFEKDLREDDVEKLLDAIRMIRGVLTVDTSLTVTTMNDHMNRERVRRELGEKLWDVLYPKDGR